MIQQIKSTTKFTYIRFTVECIISSVDELSCFATMLALRLNIETNELKLLINLYVPVQKIELETVFNLKIPL